MTTTLLSSSAAVAGADAAEIDGYRRLWAAPSPLLAARAGIVHRDVDGVHCAAVTAWRNGRPVTHALGFEGGDETS